MEKKSSNSLRVVLKKYLNTAEGIFQGNCEPHFEGIQPIENWS